MEEENQIKSVLQENQNLAEANKTLNEKLNIAMQGLKALYSGGETTGIAKVTLEEINKIDNKDLPQED